MPDKVVELHEPGLNCPVCRVALVMSERQNIEIDYCPKCRGVWLDRGELDKIIERSVPAAAAPAPAEQARRAAPPDPYYGNDGHRSSGHGSKHGGGHGRSDHGSGHGNSGYRRKSWLREIFD